jgi:hypothetical protein
MYKHMPVDKLEREHQASLKFRETHMDTTDEETRRQLARVSVDVMGLPATRQLAEFCYEVRKIARGVKFAATRNGKATWLEGHQLVSEVWVYYPDDEFAFARIGYADYSVSGTNSKYGVYSRHIENQKFGDDREQRHMVLSDDLARAVRNFKKYLRRYSLQETATMRLGDFSSKISTLSWGASTEYASARSGLVEHPSFYDEMCSLLDRGYEFINPAFKLRVAEMVEKKKIAAARSNAVHHAYYVTARDQNGEQVFDVIFVCDLKHTNSTQTHYSLSMDAVEALEAELPHKLAALSMLEDGGFVEGLGMRVSAKTYWVLK